MSGAGPDPHPVSEAGHVPWLGEDVEAWDRFWQAGHRACCYQDDLGRYLPPIRERWHELFARLPRHARLLDLGTGHGAVPRECVSWIEAVPKIHFEIDAVDYAAIEPSGMGHRRCRVRFHPRTDCRQLPFSEDRFDAVTAQFALEYLPLGECAGEIRRCLRRGGLLRAVCHVRGGVSTLLAERELAELDRLFGARLLEQTRAVVREPGDEALADLRAMADALGRQLAPTDTLTPMVLGNLDRLYGQREVHGADAVVRAVARLEAELQGHRRRLVLLRDSALDAHRQEVLAGALSECGFVEVGFRPVQTPDSRALLAVQVDARAG